MVTHLPLRGTNGYLLLRPVEERDLLNTSNRRYDDMARFDTLTEDEIALVCDTTKSAKEIAEILGVFWTSVSRWRKQLGVRVPTGSKKGKPKPEQSRRVEVACHTCGDIMSRTPSSVANKDRLYCGVKCMSSCGDRRSMLSSMDRSYMKTEEYSIAKSKPDTPAYRRYRNRVTKLTEKTYQENIDTINPERHPRTLAGVDGGYQLDHIVSVREGFDNGISEEEMSKLENLQLLPWKKNLEKGCK
jgi:hypothetical protein